MDGAKHGTDTLDNSQLRICGRQAYCLDRSFLEREDGPSSNENPGISRI